MSAETIFTIYDIIKVVVENLIITFFLFNRMTLRRQEKTLLKEICFLFLSALAAYICIYTELDITLSQIIVFIIRMLFVSYLFDNIFWDKAFNSCLPCFMALLADQFIILINYVNNYLFNKIHNFKEVQHIFSFITSNIFLLLALYLLIEYFTMLIFKFILDDISLLSGKIYGFMIVIASVTLLFSTFFLSNIIEIDPKIIDYMSHNPYNPISFQMQFHNIRILIIILFMSILFLNQVTNKTFTDNIKLTEQLHIREKNEERNRTLLQSAEKIHKWKHDYTNHLIAMKGLIEKEAYSQLLQYVNSQLDKLPNTFPTIDTGHPVIDAILTDKYAEAQTKDIKFNYSVILPEKIPVNDIELTGLLGNLLDNAIEACLGPDTAKSAPYIEFEIKPKRNMLYIGVKNSSSGKYNFNSDGSLRTTKNNSETHGRGLSNIIDIIKTHSGLYNISPETNYFSVDIYIPL